MKQRMFSNKCKCYKKIKPQRTEGYDQTREKNVRYKTINFRAKLTDQY